MPQNAPGVPLSALVGVRHESGPAVAFSHSHSAAEPSECHDVQPTSEGPSGYVLRVRWWLFQQSVAAGRFEITWRRQQHAL